MVDVVLDVNDGSEEIFRARVRTTLHELLGRGSVQDYLQAAVVQAARYLVADVAYSLSVLWEEDLLTVAASEPDARRADQVESVLDEGPCLDALRQGRSFVSDALDAEDRWPDWAAAAAALDYRSAAGVSAALEGLEGEVRIALNCFARRTAAFDDALVERSRWFTLEVAATLPLVLRLAEQAQLVDQLQQALASRSMIDQALGVVMGRTGCSRDDAFAQLRRASQDGNVKLRDVAASVLTGATGRPPAVSHPFVPASSRSLPGGRRALLSGGGQPG